MRRICIDNKILEVDAYSLLCNVKKDFTLPESLREFLSRDDQGIEGLLFMIKDPKLCRRIPSDVRAAYEIILANTSEDLDKALESAIKSFQSLLDNDAAKKEIIHKFIQAEYEQQSKE